VHARARGNEVRLVGASVEVGLAKKVLEELYAALRSGETVRARDVRQAVRMVSRAPDMDPDGNSGEVYEDVLSAVGSRRRIVAKNLSQRRYIELMRTRDIVLASGPARTGKTYLAMAMAISALNRQDVSRVVLTRPAVEAGEKLGFLPGDVSAKVDPYLRPLYDALYDTLEPHRAERLLEQGTIEVAPLAFMRGRTLDHSVMILDEAQNTTTEQMKMFLTRIGFGSKAVVTGDVTQIDLPTKKHSGLVEARQIVHNIRGIQFVEFDEKDVVRHPLVQRIVRAYDAHHRPEVSDTARSASAEDGAAPTR